MRAVEHADEGPRLFAVSGAGGELEVAPCRRVEEHEGLVVKIGHAAELREGALLRLREIFDEPSRRGHGALFVIHLESRERGHAEGVAKFLLRGAEIVSKLMPTAGFYVRGREIRHDAPGAFKLLVAHELGGMRRGQNVRKAGRPVLPLIFVEPELPRADVRPREPECVAVEADGSEIVGDFLVQDLLLHHGARGDHSHDVALQHAFRGRGVGELLAYRDAETRVDETADIVVHRVIRHSAHGGAPVLQAAVPSREGEIEHPRRGLRVVEKHLVKVPEPEKEQTIGIIGFDLEISLHHRREFVNVYLHHSSALPKRDAERASFILTRKNSPTPPASPGNVTSLPLAVLPHSIPGCLGATSSASTSYTPPT